MASQDVCDRGTASRVYCDCQARDNASEVSGPDAVVRALKKQTETIMAERSQKAETTRLCG
jgi:hypothetical protein